MIKKRKKIVTSIATVSMAAMMTTMNVYALGWQHNMTGWRYGTNELNTTWHANGWQWIDGNNDGIAECYYFDSNGYMLASTTTPDGFTVNANGAWTVNGVVQTKIVGTVAIPSEQNGKEGTKSASAVNTVSESEDESDTTVNTEDSDGDIKDDTSKKPETEVENQEASESSEM